MATRPLNQMRYDNLHKATLAALGRKITLPTTCGGETRPYWAMPYTLRDEVEVLVQAVCDFIDKNEPVHRRAKGWGELGETTTSVRFYELSPFLRKCLGYRYVRTEWYYENWKGGADYRSATYSNGYKPLEK